MPRPRSASLDGIVYIDHGQPVAATPTGPAELSVDVLVQQVLQRNPTLAEMSAAWQAARARYPQVTSLEDPMFGVTIGPGTFAPDEPDINFAYRVEISQKLPYPGKRRLRGESALAEASAAGHEVENTRLELIASVHSAFYDYYLVDRALAINNRAIELLSEFQRNAQSRFVNGLVPQQDVLLARVEIGRQQERELTLERMRQVARARINTLLHQPPDTPLPPPPKDVHIAGPLPEATALRQLALTRRPDLQAEADRLRADEAALGLAHKDYYPDFEPFVMYDRFMGNNEASDNLATMVGVRLNLPVYRAKRCAAVNEAAARVAQRRAALERRTDEIAFQVEQAVAEVRESERTVRLYRERILPDAEANIRAAQSAYVTGKIPALNVIEAERELVGLQDRSYEALADYFRRRAALERAVGGPLPGDEGAASK